jgi:hypothetical protein
VLIIWGWINLPREHLRVAHFRGKNTRAGALFSGRILGGWSTISGEEIWGWGTLAMGKYLGDGALFQRENI